MSIVSSLLMISLLWLIYLSKPSSATRHLFGVGVYYAPLQNTNFQDPMQNIEKAMEVERTTKMKPSQVNATKLHDEDKKERVKTESETTIKNEVGNHKPKYDINHEIGRNISRGRRPFSKNSVKSKHPKVVSWRVPRTENEVPQTAFNLDYAPPKVHPPTHN